MILKGWMLVVNTSLSLIKLNETEMKLDGKDSSSNEEFVFYYVPHFCSNSLKNRNSIESSKSEGIELLQDPLVKFLKEYQLKKTQESLTTLIKELTEELVRDLKFFSINENEVSSAEKRIWNIQEKYSFRILGEVLQNIYVEYNDSPFVLAGICKGLSQFELEEVLPWGPTMLAGMLNHKSEIVKEYSVALVESWADVSLLPILKHLDCHALWLREYILDVINYLEDCNVLSEKNV